MRFRERFARFMIGRYGTDQLNRALLFGSLGCMVISMFVLRYVFYSIGLVLLIICNLRMMSKNHQARYKENLFYTNQTGKVKRFFSKIKYHQQVRKTHHIYSCPQCKQKIKVPKGKGKIAVRCPKCGTEFIKKS